MKSLLQLVPRFDLKDGSAETPVVSVSNSPEFCKCCSEGVFVTYLVGIHHILPVLIKAEDGDRYQLALRTIYHSLPLRPLPLTYFAHSAMKC